MQDQEKPRQFLQLSPEGTFFGYPACCDDEFNRVRLFLSQRGLANHLQPRKLNGSGFIPCTKCNAEKTEEQLVHEINMNRMYDRPFPTNHGKDKDFDSKLESCNATGALQRRMLEKQLEAKSTHQEKVQCVQAMSEAYYQHKAQFPETADEPLMKIVGAILEEAKQKLLAS